MHISLVASNRFQDGQLMDFACFYLQSESSIVCLLCSKDNEFACDRKFEDHLRSKHLSARINLESHEVTILLCRQDCKKGNHYHCFNCDSTFYRKDKLENHVAKAVCQKKSIGTTSKESETVTCDQCEISVLRKNLRVHKKRKHTEISSPYVSIQNFHPGACVDEKNGIYLISGSYQGMRNPIHVQKLTSPLYGQKMRCTEKLCSEMQKVAFRSNIPSFECVHLQSIRFCQSQAEIANFNDDLLRCLTTVEHRFKEDTMNKCLSLNNSAKICGVPLLSFMKATDCESQRFLFFSIWTGEETSYSKFGRILVRYDSQDNQLFCQCTTKRMGCIHKSIAKWYIFQNFPESLVCSTTVLSDDFNETEIRDGDVSLSIPMTLTEEDLIVNQSEYLLQNKKIPVHIPQEFIRTDKFPCIIKCVPHQNHYVKLF